MKNILLGIVLFFLTLFISYKSMFMYIPFWVPPVGILFCLFLWMQKRGEKGSVWYVLALWNSLTWWVATLLYEDWGQSDWSFLFVKAPVIVMLLLNLPIAIVYLRFYSPAQMMQREKKGMEWLVSLTSSQQKEENNAIDFVLGEIVDDLKDK